MRPLIPFLVLALALSANAQVLQQWTHRSTATDKPGETSAAVGLGTNYMFVAENENEVLRLYRRFPTNACDNPAGEFNVRPSLGTTKKHEVDIEAAVMTGTNRIYWLGSHSNSKDGELRPNRNRLFATDVRGDGTGSPPYSLGYIGRYDHLRTDLIDWDARNLHGKGSNHFGIRFGTSELVPAEAAFGFNLEGLCLAPDGVTAYLAFRAPLVKGTNALIIPLLNLSELVAGNPVAGPGKAKFGEPFTLDLGGRGIRSIDSNFPGHYLIIAGPADNSGDFRLYTWAGKPADAPVEQRTKIPADFHPESAVPPATPLTEDTVVELLSDDSAACWRSFTVRLGAPRSGDRQ